MKFNDKQTPTPQQQVLPEKPSPKTLVIQNRLTVEDNDEDPISTEGYLPEIYFSLKSDNPADW
jgi:hypothetical protein